MNPREAFISVVQNGDSEEVLRRLAEDPSLVNTRADDGFSVLMHALYRGHHATAEALLAHHPDLDLFEASAAGATGRVRELLSADADVYGYSPDGWTALHLAAFFGHPETAEALLDEGADLHALSRNPTGVTPLQSALARGEVETAKLLLSHGAHVNGEPSEGWAPLHYCAAQGLTEMAELLLQEGADPNRTQGAGKTPLALAEENEHQELADLLRRHGAH